MGASADARAHPHALAVDVKGWLPGPNLRACWQQASAAARRPTCESCSAQSSAPRESSPRSAVPPASPTAMLRPTLSQGAAAALPTGVAPRHRAASRTNASSRKTGMRSRSSMLTSNCTAPSGLDHMPLSTQPTPTDRALVVGAGRGRGRRKRTPRTRLQGQRVCRQHCAVRPSGTQGCGAGRSASRTNTQRAGAAAARQRNAAQAKTACRPPRLVRGRGERACGDRSRRSDPHLRGACRVVRTARHTGVAAPLKATPAQAHTLRMPAHALRGRFGLGSSAHVGKRAGGHGLSGARRRTSHSARCAHGTPMRHGIPCGTVSHAARYPMRHGIPCVARAHAHYPLSVGAGPFGL